LLCEENGLECHSFETALGAEVSVETEPGAEADLDETEAP
jgi:hypothetical protein